MQIRLKSSRWFACLLFAAVAAARGEVVFPYGADWKYLLGTGEASTPATLWRTAGYIDSTWLTAVAPVGYGELSVATEIPSSTVGNYTSVYLRKPFSIVNPAAITDLLLNLRCDDGYVAWINGVEVGRFNVPAGELPYNATAMVAGEPVEVTVPLAGNLTSLLVAGANEIAVQVFNSDSASGDLLFDAALQLFVDDQPPLIDSILPTPDTVVTELGFITVSFTENVTGVGVGDLFINGSPIATSLTVISPREYTFSFPPPPTGGVIVAWAPGHGITDQSFALHPFVGGSWAYTFDPNAVPVVALISEFMADNAHGTNDEDGARSDWIEIYNPGPADINLAGWSLTDTETNLTQWRFPAVTLAATKYLLVWASAKDRTNALTPLHTNFKLGKSGGYLALVNPLGVVVSEFGPTYPPQQSDISYGRAAGDPSILGFFTTPTPGRQNSTSGTGFAPPPQFSIDNGIYTNASLAVSLSAPAGVTIRFTLDGSVPTGTSTLYTNPINFTASTMIKARAYQGTLFPSPVVGRTFIMLDTNATVQNFSSKLPIVVLSSGGRAIPGDIAPGTARPVGTVAVIDTFRGRSSFQLKPDYLGFAGLEVFGQTSAGFAQTPFRIELDDEYGNDQKVSILGLPAESDWKLRNPYSDKCLINDFLAYELFEKMGHYSCRRRLVEVFVDSGGGKLKYPEDYYGVEVLFEAIEVSKNRVNIAELTPGTTNEPAISGGYMFKKDKNSPGDLDFATAGSGALGFSGQGLKLHEPKPRTVGNNANHPQVAWLRNYLNRFEASMYAPNWTNATGTNHYSYYIDVDAFVDQHWIVEFPKQIDGYRLSDYFSKDRNGKLKPVPIWDWNLSFGNANYLDGGHFSGWYWTQLGENDHIWLRRLMAGTAGGNSETSPGDPDFKQKIVDRWGVLRTNVLAGSNIVARIDELAALLSEAAPRDFAKFPRLYPAPSPSGGGPGYVWPNPEGPPAWDIDYVHPTTHAGIISEMKKWVSGRYTWIDSQFTRQPALNQNGGAIASGFKLQLTAPVGTIYYTLNGTDPRSPGGTVSPSALVYSAQVTLTGNARVFARAKASNGWGWSPPTIATFVVSTPQLVISEIMYHPAPPPPGSLYVADDFEYVELKNTGVGTLALTGFTLSGGIDFRFITGTLAAGQTVLVVHNRAAFESRYGISLNVAGEFTGSLNNAGDHVALTGPLNEPILDFNYQDVWYPITDGTGFSLVVVDPNAPLASWNTAANWRLSAAAGGSPGANDPAPVVVPGVLITEVLANPNPGQKDAIELFNPTAGTADIGGWFLSDDRSNPKKFRIPNGVSIGAGGYRVFTSDDFDPTPGAGTSFGLSSSGDSAYLFSGDANTNLTGYLTGFDFGASEHGVSFGRYECCGGLVDYPAQISVTLGLPNFGPKVGPVVISEIMYRPPDVFLNNAYWDNDESEYVELYNTVDDPVALYDVLNPANTWKLKKAVDYVFPPGVILPPHGYLLVVNFDPIAKPSQLAALRARYGLDAGLPVYGPYGPRQLDNSGESLELAKPGLPDAVTGDVPYILVDRVQYRDLPPWPAAADGIGASLQRINPSGYGNDPANWTVGLSPGRAYGGSAPVITQQPVSLTVVQGNPAAFTVAASGSAPFIYLWQFNGNSLNSTLNSNTLAFPSTGLTQAGNYSVKVFNAAGYTNSQTIALTVLPLPVITTQPQSTNASPGSNVTLRVSATGTGTVSYQWRFNDTNLAGATAPTLTVTNVQLKDIGGYTVVVTDTIGSIVSQRADLVVLIKPFFTVQPPPEITVVEGATVTISVVAGPVHPALPLSYKWRRDGATVTNSATVTGATNSTITLLNVRTNQSGKYTVILTNLASAGVLSSAAVLTVFNATDAALDPDGDGFNNIQEFIAGTDPLNAASYLKIDLLGGGPGARTIQWLASTNKTYSVLYTDSLTNHSWLKVADVAARATNWTAIATDTNTTSGARFYRLTTPKLP